jgi:hypothetical protein
MSNRNLTHTDKFSKYLIGRKICGIRYLERAEIETMGWYKSPMVLILDDDTQIILQSDDEGNDGGAAWIYNPSKKIDETIYTI